MDLYVVFIMLDVLLSNLQWQKVKKCCLAPESWLLVRVPFNLYL